MPERLIYLNNSATSFPKPPGVAEAVARAISNEPPGHGRGPSERPRDSITPMMTRAKIAELINASSVEDIALTFNASDGLNLAIRGILDEGDHAICTALDHNSVLRPLAHLRRERDINYTVAHVSGGWEIEAIDLKSLIGERTRLLIVNHISNVTGYVTDIYAMAELAAKSGIVLLVDAAQSGGHLPIDVSKLGVSMVALTGHKGLLGPAGTGALWVHPDIELKPFRAGGTGILSEVEFQPDERPMVFEAGTPNLHGLAGLHTSINFILEKGVNEIHSHEFELSRALWDGLSQIEGITLYGPGFEMVRGAVVSFNIEGIEPETLAAILRSEFNIVVRSGLHCAPYAHKALGTFPSGTVRVSPGLFNKMEDVEVLLNAVKHITAGTVSIA